MPQWVKKIAEQYLSEDYVIIDLVGEGPENKTPVGINHYLICVPDTNYNKKIKALDLIIKQYSNGGKLMVFCDTKKKL